METIELHSRGKGWTPQSPSSDGDKVSDTEFGKIQAADSADMHRMGKKQEFRRNFHVVSISSFCLAVMMGFVFIPINSTYAIAAAGTGGAIVMFICNFFGFLMIVLILAEMSSIAPTAGGQYHWVSEFAPAHLQKLLSYYSGWLSALAWLVGAASSIFLPGDIIPAVAALAHPDFHPEPWHSYLVIVAVAVSAYLINVYLVKYLPLLEGFIAAYMIIVFFSLIITLLVLSPEKNSAAVVFQSFEPIVGGSNGVMVVLSSQILLFFSLLGSDSVVHMAEECSNASKVVPRAMVGAYTIMGTGSFITLCVYSACFVDYSVLEAPYPFLQVFGKFSRTDIPSAVCEPFAHRIPLVTSTGSTTGALALASTMILCIFLSVLNFTAATSRQIFAFARDDGLPFRHWIARVNRKSGSPQNALVVVILFVVLIALIVLGSSVAFQAIISLGTLALAFTYELSILCLVWRRVRGAPLLPYVWSLGRAGLSVNIAGSVYGFYLMFFAVIPPAYPVTAANFNWSPVMFVGVMGFASVYYWVVARKVYRGPVVVCQPVYA